jgi:hypothetical protein
LAAGLQIAEDWGRRIVRASEQRDLQPRAGMYMHGTPCTGGQC